jgi:hypothetical protein
MDGSACGREGFGKGIAEKLVAKLTLEFFIVEKLVNRGFDLGAKTAEESPVEGVIPVERIPGVLVRSPPLQMETAGELQAPLGLPEKGRTILPAGDRILESGIKVSLHLPLRQDEEPRRSKLKSEVGAKAGIEVREDAHRGAENIRFVPLPYIEARVEDKRSVEDPGRNLCPGKPDGMEKTQKPGEKQ